MYIKPKDRLTPDILKNVSKPGRYSGGEYGQVIKNLDDIKLRFAFCFPDTYEIGMSNLGMRILYGSLNEEKDIWCERVFAPWIDMEEIMRRENIPLWAHESGDALSCFDIVGFTLQYELCYTTMLNMLSLAGFPLYAADRDDSYPIIIAGGPCTYNPEPVADFVDIFSIGEGEESLVELSRLCIEMKGNGTYTKEAFLREASHLKGFYVPSLYEVSYNEDGTMSGCVPKYSDVPARVEKRIIADMDKAYFPKKPVMPYIETVHDRIMLEVYRGCIRGCRFCQAGMVYRPVREKSPETLCSQAKELFEATGYDEISLTSLSISDYSCMHELTDMLLEWTDEAKINLSLPSLRADSFTEELMQKISTIRSSSLTFAPEAGTQRLRDAINKNVTEEDILGAVRIAFGAGKNLVKLYFMNGLPTETDEDIEGIALLAKKVVDEYYKNPKRIKSRQPTVTVSVACFIPKPHTPFQWEPQCTFEELEYKQDLLNSKITDRKVTHNWHDAKVSRIEAVFARGDRKLAKALYAAVNEGMRFDAWDEQFDYDRWIRVFEENGIDAAFYANRRYGDDEVLPWDVIDSGVEKKFLLSERDKAYAGTASLNCKQDCSNCGILKLCKNTGEEVLTKWCPKKS